MKMTQIRLGMTLMLLAAGLGGIAASGQAASPPPSSGAESAAPGVKSIPYDPVTRSPIAGTSSILPKPIFPTAEREDSKFTVQYVYNFARYRYTPAVAVEEVKRPTASYTTPEEACIAFLSSMTTLDYDWWLSNWDPDSRKKLEADNQAHHQDADFWRGAWQHAFAGRVVTLEQRLESGPYVLIVFRIADPRDPSKSFSDALPFRLYKDKWLATEELAADNFSIYALDGRSRIEQSGVLSPIHSYDPTIYDSAKGQMEFFTDYPKGKESVTTVVR